MYIILAVETVEDIPLCYYHPIVHNIIHSQNLDCSNTSNVTKKNKYFVFCGRNGKESFLEEELDPDFIPNRCKDVPQITWDEIRHLTSNHISITTDNQNGDSLTQICGQSLVILVEVSEKYLVEVSEEQSNNITSSSPCNNHIQQCPEYISSETVPKHQRTSQNMPWPF